MEDNTSLCHWKHFNLAYKVCPKTVVTTAPLATHENTTVVRRLMTTWAESLKSFLAFFLWEVPAQIKYIICTRHKSKALSFIIIICLGTLFHISEVLIPKCWPTSLSSQLPSISEIQWLQCEWVFSLLFILKLLCGPAWQGPCRYGQKFLTKLFSLQKCLTFPFQSYLSW